MPNEGDGSRSHMQNKAQARGWLGTKPGLLTTSLRCPWEHPTSW